MILPRAVHAVVFDMDGLLCDTEALIRDAMVETARKHGADLPFAVFAQMIGATDVASDAIARAHFGAGFDFDAYRRALHLDVRERLLAGAPLKPGVRELLDHLDRRALPFAIATSSSHDSVQLHLGKSGIVPRFQAIVARGDYERGKPHPHPFLKAAERLGVAPAHCLALEDSHNGIRSAHAAGMMAVMVPDLLEATDEMRGLCVYIANSLREVPALLALA